MKPIGEVLTCFTEKFGVPRQSLMVEQARGRVILHPEFSHPDLFLHLNGFSHVWLIYLFHKAITANHPDGWTPTIQPPRIDAPPRVGVFASRSPHRPNPIGMSVVKLERIYFHPDGRAELEVSGVDILDGTPLLDIKPYLPYADAIHSAKSGWIKNEIEKFQVLFSDAAKAQAEEAGIFDLMMGVLEWDPRPRSQRERDPMGALSSIGKKFAFRLMDFDIHWEIQPDSRIWVREVRRIK